MKKVREIGLLLLLLVWLIGCEGNLNPSSVPAPPEKADKALGVCPPFPLRDESGNVIDPIKGVNDKVPYSPKQTCGASGCHDYAKITEGYHFTQGKGEAPPKEFATRYNWVTSPGNYGGNWCSPAPLYRQLAQKKNTDPRTIDMTSFDFVTATCGNCHPGGGPLEYDRDGKRYDEQMRDPSAGLVPGGDNKLDGDYYRARWSETGVVEADCLLCHMPEYDIKRRNEQLANLNFRWAATAGAGFGSVSGKISANQTPLVYYDKSCFDPDGNVILHIAPEPRNEACLNCHSKPDWKKRGEAYSPRTDVHMAAGLRCVDCHAAGSKAPDPRIRGKEIHHFGKGDDPSGWVRNDLDNTVRSCESCHLQGWRNAPKATHEWLPPLHMEKLSCQACHIPVRAVKSALVQASDVYNPAPRITPPPKHIWTFYDQEMRFWNHYGELDLFTTKDEPTNVTRPTLVRYKGKIYPANRVHSAWVGFEEQSKPGLNQLFMKDFFLMWTQHQANPKVNYPELEKITDDNGDGIIEVNRPEEIDALLTAVKEYLTNTNFPMEGRRLVWVSDSYAYYSSKERRLLQHEEHEATAYASVYKFSHGVSPAKAALGSGGCIDCHRSNSPFFYGAVLDEPFDPKDGKPRWIPNYQILGISPFWIEISSFREVWLKPLLYGLLGLNGLLIVVLAFRWHAVRGKFISPRVANSMAWFIFGAGIAGGLYALYTPGLLEYMTVRRFSLDANHFWVAVIVLVVCSAFGSLGPVGKSYASKSHAILSWLSRILWGFMGLAVLSGFFMLFKVEAFLEIARLAYTLFDAALAISLLISVGIGILRLVITPDKKTNLAGD